MYVGWGVTEFHTLKYINARKDDFEQDSRLDVTSRFQQSPGECHWTVVKNIMKYLRNTKDMFLFYGSNLKGELRVTCAIDWKSANQSTTTMSSTEAEYIFASEAAMEAVWIRKFIDGFGVVPTNKEPMETYCDIHGSLIITNEPGVQKDAKHYREESSLYSRSYRGR
ncbi:hypothetical protein Tco_1070633 [Tanacetum coccineum]|uniref:Retrotransposon protein, putative, Ty1-copia subclass n=1 Tax=Tanacetum coccineum TaxID=301880 RepID=A0ABQ5HNA4_9ASTR